MRIVVKLFAILREDAGAPQASFDLPPGATVAQAIEALLSQYPALRRHTGRAAYAINQAYATPHDILKEGDELALIPPVSGGVALK